MYVFFKKKEIKFIVTLLVILLSNISFKTKAVEIINQKKGDLEFIKFNKFLDKNYDEKLKEKKILNNKINLLKERIPFWKLDKIPNDQILLINDLQTSLTSYGDPQGFCSLDSKNLNRNLESIISDDLITIIEPFYKKSNTQQLIKYGKGGIWTPSLNIFKDNNLSNEIQLLKSLKPVFGYIYGEEEAIYRGPISRDAALLIDLIIERILLKIDKDKNIKPIDKASLLAIKAANYYWPLGRVNDAIKEYQNAIDFLENIEKVELINSALAYLHGSKAYLESELSNFAEMDKDLKKAFKYFSKLKKIDVQSLVETALIPSYYGPYFGLYKNKIDYTLLFKKYISFLSTIGGRSSSTFLWANLDYLWHVYEQFPIERSLELSNDMVSKMRNCSKGYDLGYFLYQKAYFEFYKGDYDKALNTAEESLFEYVRGNGWENNASIEALGLIADIKNWKGEYEDALIISKKQIEIYRELGFDNLIGISDEESPLHRIYKICSYKQFENCDNKIVLKFLKDLLDYLNGNIIYLSTQDRLNFYDAIKDYIIYRSYNNNNNLKDDLTFWLSTKGVLADIEKSAWVLLNSKPENSEKINKIKILNSKLSNISQDNNLNKKLFEQKKILERSLFKTLPEISPKIISADEIVKLLPNDSALIEFKEYIPYDINNPDGSDNNKRYLAFLITDKGVIEKFDIGSSIDIENKINAALLSTKEGLSDSERKWSEVRNLIIKPMQNEINNVKTLFISPDNLLHNVPFNGLPRYQFFKKSYFGSEVRINLISTGRDLINLSKPIKTESSNSLVVANPDFNFEFDFDNRDFIGELNYYEEELLNDNSSNWKSLPNTEKEGIEIAKILNANLLNGIEASTASITNFKNPKIIHIASHVDFSIKKNDNSKPLIFQGSIPLAGANNPENSYLDDGYLNAIEISQLDWSGSELVVISGCNSIKGQFIPGEGIFGLKRAISLAGSRSSLLSLWEVNDEATADFMIIFYQNLVSGLSRSEALIATQETFRKHKKLDYRQPYIWGAFQLSGDWRKINF